MKLSIIGAAQIVSQYHIHALNALDNVDVDFIVDLDINSASEVAKICDAKPSTAISDALGSDVIFIATPPSTRSKILEGLKDFAGKIVMEKPAAMGIDPYYELCEFSHNRNTPLYIAQTRRYFLNLQAINHLVGTGLVGNVREVAINEGGILNWVSNSNHLSNSAESNLDKGILQDVGSHILDYLNCLCESLDVCLGEFSLLNIDVDFKNLTNDLKFSLQGPFLVNIHLSRSKSLANRISINGDLGSVSTRSLLDDSLRVVNSDGVGSLIKTRWSKSEYTLESAFISMWRDLLDLDQKTNTLKADIFQLEQGMKIMQLIINKINL